MPIRTLEWDCEGQNEAASHNEICVLHLDFSYISISMVQATIISVVRGVGRRILEMKEPSLRQRVSK